MYKYDAQKYHRKTIVNEELEIEKLVPSFVSVTSSPYVSSTSIHSDSENAF